MRIYLKFLIFSATIWYARGEFLGINQSIRKRNTSFSKILDSHSAPRIFLPKYLERFVDKFQQNYQNEDFLKPIFQGTENPQCMGHLIEWLSRFVEGLSGNMDITNKENQWVVQMIDALGKLPEGILRGHVNSWGDYNECVAVRATNVISTNPLNPGTVEKTFEGMYCNVFMGTYDLATEDISVKPSFSKSTSSGSVKKYVPVAPKKKSDYIVSVEELLEMLFGERAGYVGSVPSIGTCIPNTCTHRDFQQIVVNLASLLYNDKTTMSPEDLPWPYVLSCADAEKPAFDAATISVIVLISVLGVICIISGIVDYCMQHYIKRPAPTSLTWHYLMAFSLYTNIKKWAKVTRSPEDFGCLHGLRFLSMAWVILAHTYEALSLIPPYDSIKGQKAYENWTVLAVINGFYAVDTFFVLSGMLVTYNLLKILKKDGKFNIVMFYVHRYLRLTPTYAILIGIMATLVPYLGSGPFWSTMEYQSDLCRKKWWTNLLYVNNLVWDPGNMCHGESWYLANDMQFYVISPLIIYPLWKWRKTGLGLFGVYTILSLICPVVMVHLLDTPPTYIFSRDLNGYHPKIYIKPYTRIQIYFAGMWLGWLLFKTRGKSVRLRFLAQLSGWILSTASALILIFIIQPWFDPTAEISKFWGLLYAGLSRFLWGMVISWIIFACVKGYGGVVNRFLSWSPFVPLGRLCFCTYLVSMNLQYMFHSRFTQPAQYDTYTIVHYFLGHLVMSLMVGFVCTLVFESPFIILEKLLFEGAPKPKTQLVDQQAKVTEAKRTA